MIKKFIIMDIMVKIMMGDDAAGGDGGACVAGGVGDDGGHR